MGTPPDRNTRRLQADDALFRWKLVAGIGSVVLLAGFFVTSLVRGPNPVYSVIVAAAALLLAAAMAWGARRALWRRRHR